nr:hypothetical protein [Tanacetum cinerariifolium]
MAGALICFKMCYKDPTVNPRVKDMYVYSVANLMTTNKTMIKCETDLRSIFSHESERYKSSRFILRCSREKQLRSLDSYLGKSKDQASTKSVNNDLVSSATSEEISQPPQYLVKNELSKADDHSGSKSDYEDETSGLYIISTMVSINIAVYLWIRGVKKAGQVARQSPEYVYQEEGEGTICSANLRAKCEECPRTKPNVKNPCGPVFAIIGAWLIYQYQNKDAMRKEEFEKMYQKAVVATALGFVLSTLGPIDDWTHFGSAFTGLAYGFVTCPTLQIDDSSSEIGKENNMTLIQRNAHGEGFYWEEWWRSWGVVWSSGKWQETLSFDLEDGRCIWPRVFNMKSFCSNEDHVARISKSVFVTNFPKNFGPQDLWKLCEVYGKVVDVFIPKRKSKAGKQFAFVRFVRVDDMDRLIGNLCTLWVGCFHLHANTVRYERSLKPSQSMKFPTSSLNNHVGSYAAAVNGSHIPNGTNAQFSCSSTLVLDDTCVNNVDLSRHVMGKAIDLKSIPNLHTILIKEGFEVVYLSYLGGMWVLIKVKDSMIKQKLIKYTGVKSWFHVLQEANPEFVSNERIVWVDLEGIPFNFWSHATFEKIGKKWGEVMDIEESPSFTLARKRLCIKISLATNILETFKVTFKGKVFLVRAKELFTWTPCFMEYKDSGYMYEDDSICGTNNKLNESRVREEVLVHKSDDEGVADMIFGDNSPSPNNDEGEVNGNMEVQQSEDPFGFYELLKKPPTNIGAVSEASLSHPPGFTPEASHQDNNHHDTGFGKDDDSESILEKESSPWGLILDILDDMIKVGQSMGYDMEGCSKDIERIIGLQGATDALQETKMKCISHMDVKSIWGNSNYKFVASGSLGNSGGILSVWEDSIFTKDDVSISDIFIPLYGTWLPTNSKVLIVKRETIVLGDFSVVRFEEERFRSVFNQSCTRDFNQFISSSGLVEVKIEGYSFTWSHPSATKMNHRPILLNEIHSDFGPTPFRMYHSWFNRDGFDAMVEQAWRSFTHNDSNGLIKFKKKLQYLKQIIRAWIKETNKSYHRNSNSVKRSFFDHFVTRFQQPGHSRLKIGMSFPKHLSPDQVEDLDKNITLDEIRAVLWFFDHDVFPRGCNSSFIALIPKVMDAKFVTDFRPISLIGSVYKVVTKILANRLAMDFLLDVLQAFGFGPMWCKWISGIFSSGIASILVNGSPTAEFPFFCGLKQGDPLAPLLFILVMESLHISISRAANDDVFKGPDIQNLMSLTHLFYADDAVFIGEWSDDNLDNLIKILNCFHLASGLKINVSKSHLLGVGVPLNIVNQGASRISCSVMHLPFKFLGVMVKTLSIGGRLTLLKSVLGAVPIYNMSIYKTPKGVLNEMEMLRNRFFNGADTSENKITWVAWDKVLASKKKGGLGVSSFFSLNRALLLKWVWQFLSQDGSLWSQVIGAIYSSRLESYSLHLCSTWSSILRETHSLAAKGFDFLSHCKFRVGNGLKARFWLYTWILDSPLRVRFPHLFALESAKDVCVAEKCGDPSLDTSFHRLVRDGSERQQWLELVSMIDVVSLSSALDRWVCDFNGDGVFYVKDIRSKLDDLFLPSSDVVTRWVRVNIDSPLCPICGLTLC